MNKIKYLIVFLFCLCPLWAVGQNQVASGTVSDDLGPLMGVYVGEIDAANRTVHPFKNHGTVGWKELYRTHYSLRQTDSRRCP